MIKNNVTHSALGSWFIQFINACKENIPIANEILFYMFFFHSMKDDTSTDTTSVDSISTKQLDARPLNQMDNKNVANKRPKWTRCKFNAVTCFRK